MSELVLCSWGRQSAYYCSECDNRIDPKHAHFRDKCLCPTCALKYVMNR